MHSAKGCFLEHVWLAWQSTSVDALLNISNLTTEC